MTRRRNKGVVIKKIIFGISFVLFGTYILGFTQLINPNSRLDGYPTIMLWILLAAIPWVYLVIPKKNNFNKRFFKNGTLFISIFLIISTIFLYSFTLIQINNINNEYENSKNQFEKDNIPSNKLSQQLYYLDKLNFYLIMLISLIAFLLTGYYNAISIKKGSKVQAYLHSFILYFIQMIYSVIAIGFIYIRI